MVDEDIMLKISYDDSINQIKTKKCSTIEDLKYNIQKKLNYPIEKQVLIFKGDILKNNKEINYYNIKDNNLIILVIEQNENEDISINENNKTINTNNSINQNRKNTIPSNNNFNLQKQEIDSEKNRKKNFQKTDIDIHNQNNNYKTSIQNSKNNIGTKIKEDINSSSSKGFLHDFNLFLKSIKNMVLQPEQIFNAFNNPLFKSFFDDDPEIRKIFTSPQNILELTKSKKYEKFANIVNIISKGVDKFYNINKSKNIEKNKENNNNDDEDEDYYNINYHKMNNNNKTKYENELRQLNELGFDNQLCIQLLNKYNGDIEKCVEELLK